MKAVIRGLTLVSVLLAALAGWPGVAAAQVATTTVQDTVYRADGTTAGGTVIVSWNAFTTAAGSAVPAGRTTVTIGTGGVLTVALASNAQSTPMGSYYTAVFHLDDGTTSREYWVVPTAIPGGGPAKLAAIRNTVLPTSVAMQTVSKAYVDNAIAAAQTGFPSDASPYVLKAGDTMTGPLSLPADPVSAAQAADKNYVDESVAAVAAGLAQKVSTLPSATQVVAQPIGTQLDVNDLNGDLYASQFASGGGNNGIANALSSADCTAGCEVRVESTYAPVENLNTAAVPAMGDVVDARGGAEVRTSVNPLGVGSSFSASQTIAAVETLSTPQLEVLRPGSIGIGSAALQLSETALTGGSNQFPESIETPPYSKSTYGVLSMKGTYNTQGQHVQAGNNVNCFAVGDCLAGSQYILSSGGYRDDADEGTHPFDLEVAEDLRVFAGLCATGCSAGSENLTATISSNGGTQGDGRFLIDKNSAKVISTGTLTGGGRSIFATATFSGTSFPVSVFLSTAQAATSQPTNLSPGTVTLAIATTGVTAGFATNTAALPASAGVACMSDPVVSGQEFPNYEMANYNVIDASHIQLTLNKVHASGATISVGGLCGYGLEQTVDTVNGIRQLFPVVGSISSTSLYYADALTPVVGISAGVSTSGYLKVALTVASIARSANVVTVSTVGNLPEDINGLTMAVSGVADSSYSGSYVVTTTGPNTLTYPNTGSNSTSSGGTLSLITGGFALYPMAEVLSVYDASTHLVDGAFRLAPNTVPWATGDAIEEPHYYQQYTFADTESITQYVPRPIAYVSAGKFYGGQLGPGVRGWQITNAVPLTNYLGAGGTHSLPDDAYLVAGAWTNDIEVDAGANSIVRAHCNLHTCNRWDSGYALFDLDSSAGEDFLTYHPQSSTATWQLGGVSYSFSPTAFTANTINVGTLNATTITGGVSAGAITSGTVNAARLPVFGPSGTTHSAGIVPDPGALAGATKFLREDGTWDVPAGSGGSPSGTAGGDLSGTYPNPAVSAVHATAGTLDNVAIGGTTPAAGSFTILAETGAATNSANGAANTPAALFSGSAYAGTGATATPLVLIRPAGATPSSSWQTGGTYLGIDAAYGTARLMDFHVNGGSTFSVDQNGSVYALGFLDSSDNDVLMTFSNAAAWGVTVGRIDATSGAAATSFFSNAGATGHIHDFRNSGGLAAYFAQDGSLAVPQIVGSGPAPTVVAGTAAGSGASATISGTNLAGVISVSTGTGTTASAPLATITFGGTLSTAPQGCTLMPRNANAAAAVAAVYSTAPSTSTWIVEVGGTAAPGGSLLAWSYSCL